MLLPVVGSIAGVAVAAVSAFVGVLLGAAVAII